MGLSQSSQAQKLYEFRKLTIDQGTYEIPEKPENRRPTDRKYLIAFIVVLIVLIPCLIYTLMHTELKRITTGSDNCGNFCGYKNKKYDEWPCSGQDYTDRKYQLLHEIIMESDEYLIRRRECVSICPVTYDTILDICVKKNKSDINDSGIHSSENSDINDSGINSSEKSDINEPGTHSSSSGVYSPEAVFIFLGEVGRDIGRGWWAILLSTVISYLLCFGSMVLFRYAIDFLVWFILIGSIGILTILAGFFWYAYVQVISNPNYKQSDGGIGLIIMACFFSLLALCFLIIITCMLKRVKLIIQLFKETTKCIFDIPSLILAPVWTSMLVIVSFSIFIILTFFLLMSGVLTQVVPGYLEYIMNGMMTTTIFYNIFVYIWITQFIIGSQYMIIAGAVSAWFFTRNKHSLEAPLWISFTNFLNFHMGTVAVGSLVITIMTIIRALIRSLAENDNTKWLIYCCLEQIEEFLRFLSKNSYIQTAMHGRPFFKSGKRAAKLLVHNAVNVIAINSIGDFVLAIAQVMLVSASGVAAFFIAKSTGTQHYWAIATISILIAISLIHTFFSIFEATIDSIFICFCEDTTLNDGIAKPYFMSKGLMKFIEDSKAMYPKKESH